MMYAVKKNTIQVRAIETASDLLTTEVLYDGELFFASDGKLAMVWDDILNTIRPFNLTEKRAEKIAYLKAEIKGLTGTKIAKIYGKEAATLDLAFAEGNAAGTAISLQEIEIAKMREIILLLVKDMQGVALSPVEISQIDAFVVGVFTPEEQATKSAIKGGFNLLTNIRTHGKMLKTSLLSTDPDTFDPTKGWPS